MFRVKKNDRKKNKWKCSDCKQSTRSHEESKPEKETQVQKMTALFDKFSSGIKTDMNKQLRELKDSVEFI